MLTSVNFGGEELVGLIVAVSFAAGLNVYATLATLGLLVHAGWVDLPSGLHLLSSWWVIAASGALFVVELFADKIPAFDLFWNALHTFVRVPVAALIAYGATAQLSPEKQLLATLAGGAIALAAHGGKTAARVAVTPSPEPVSNIALSAGEDTLAIFLTWFASQHPIMAASIVVAFLVLIVVVIGAVVRAMKKLFGWAEGDSGTKSTTLHAECIDPSFLHRSAPNHPSTRNPRVLGTPNLGAPGTPVRSGWLVKFCRYAANNPLERRKT